MTSIDLPSGQRTPPGSPSPKDPDSGPLLRVLRVVERLGNMLPHPFWLFVILSVVVVALSGVMSALGVSAVDAAEGERIHVQSLLNAEGFQRMVTDAVANFVNFPPLGMIITVMIGVGVAEGSGAISASIRMIVARVSPRWLTFTVALVGITGSVASDAIILILIPLAAAAFKAVGRSAVMGAVVAYASASAGYNASLLVIPQDAILAGISTAAAQLVDESYVVSPVANYFFSFVSSLVLAVIVTVVAELVLNRMTERLRDEEDAAGGAALEVLRAGRTDDADDADLLSYTPREVLGLKRMGLVFAALLGVYFTLLAAPWSPLAGEDGPLTSPLLTDIVPPIAIAFIILGVTYGCTTGSITAPRDIPTMMATSLKELTPIIVLFFVASQFIAYFNWSNIGTIVALNGASTLQRLDVPPLVLFAGVVVLVSIFNLMITSGSAQWTLMAPILIPMLMQVGISPEVTQALFRVADAPTNIVTPVSSYFVLVLGLVQRYYPKAGIGTLMSMTIPLAVAMLVGWFALFLAWWALGIPLGPGVPVR